MAILALALPYAGMMDMAGRSAHHNTMAFGLAILSWLWLGTTRIARNPLLVQARSTVLLLYGMLALAAVALRVLLGDATPQLLWYRSGMELSGPILLALAMIPATYFSRSLVPAGLAVAIMVILFPELKPQLQAGMPWLSWGTGLENAGWGLALTGLCFVLRPWGFLKHLPGGDLLGGVAAFPCRRHDATLFTWPLMAATVYLLLKVDTWNLLNNLLGDTLPFKTALAVGITGVAWTFIGIYHRQHRDAVIGVHLGWLCVLAGIGFGSWHHTPQPHWTWVALAMGLLLQGLYWLYRFGLEADRPWLRALLTEPTRMVLLVGSTVLAMQRIAVLLDGAAVDWMLDGFLLAQVIWHGLRTRQWPWGVLVFFQIWVGLLAVTAGGAGPLWMRVSVADNLTPTLGLLAGIQLLVLALELIPPRRSAGTGPAPPATSDRSAVCGAQRREFGFISPIMTPAFVLATAVAGLLGLAGLLDGVHGLSLSGAQQVMLLGTLLLTARAQACNPILLGSLLLAYVMIQRGPLAALGAPDAQLELLATPLRLALLGLAMAVMTQAGRWLHERKPGWLCGAFALPVFTQTACAWLFWPATVLGGAAALYHTADPALRESGVQLWTPYLGALTFALVARFWRRDGFFCRRGRAVSYG
jgi:hypothetical protein